MVVEPHFAFPCSLLSRSDIKLMELQGCVCALSFCRLVALAVCREHGHEQRRKGNMLVDECVCGNGVAHKPSRID
jgi:hypothetical protein